MRVARLGADPAAKIADLFAGIQQYGLRGFVYLDTNSADASFAITSPGALAAFRKGAGTYHRPAS